MLDTIECQSLEAHRKQSSLNFVYKSRSGIVSLDKDKLMKTAPNVKRTRSTYDAQRTRYIDKSGAMKNSFFPSTFPM